MEIVDQSALRKVEGLRLNLDLDDLPSSYLPTGCSSTTKREHMLSNGYSLLKMNELVSYVITYSLFLPSPQALSYEGSLFHLCEEQIGFQRSNALNQLEDITLTLCALMNRRRMESCELTDSERELHLAQAISEMHSRALQNYVNWAAFIDVDPFPWRPHIMNEDRPEALLMIELILYRLIWGESSCARHLPECLCFLLLWTIRTWTKTTPAEFTFLDSITPLMQRVRDEQWIGAKSGRFIDHDKRMNYDDLNEIFWTPKIRTWLNKFVSLTCSDEFLIRQRPSPQLMSEVLNMLTGSAEALCGDKTFHELRHYFSVLLVYKRVFRLHVVWFPMVWTIYYALHGDNYEGFSGSITCAYALQLTIEVCIEWFNALVLGGSKYRMPRPGRFIVLTLKTATSIYVGGMWYIYGLGSPYLGFSKPHALLCSVPVMMSYALSEAWRFLLVRFRDGTVVTKFYLSSRFFRWVIGEELFGGSSVQLASRWTHVLSYALCWVVIWTTKLIYWVYFICPVFAASNDYRDLVNLRPWFVWNIAINFGLGKAVFSLAVWGVAFVLFFYDTQVGMIAS